MARPVMTLATTKVIETLLRHPHQPTYARQVGKDTGLPSGTVAPILRRLETLGWLTAEWEDTTPREAGRPRRRYYQLAGNGIDEARRALTARKGRTP